MIRNFLILTSIALGLFSHTITNSQATSLKDYTFKAASVLPFTKFESGKKYFILAREAGGKDKGTWDAFGGARDKGEIHPVQTASREFCEESINLFQPIKGVVKYIDLKSGNTKHIIANKQAVIYLTYLPKEEARMISYGFQAARKQAKQWKFREKDAIAYVAWDDLKKAIVSAPRDKNGRLVKPIQVSATVFDPAISMDPKKSKTKKDIDLRPFMVSVLQPFFQKQRFATGKNPKIKFY